ncbi:GIY-YIG nuclease family protein [Shewanella decolorationis]|uniref:GIY-YIG nuclease family protein n=1 Tax=Shewanella decolorationis TaxID=256839 RepID=A0A5B8QSS7_9GAMM|nr:GIY-YIG nuclease family protein [Shewanella decolorationis]QDZ89129.1 GIY-YIG nuclease family protein [Shewanella decolorationis]
MTDLVIEAANSIPSASLKQGASQTQAVNQAQLSSKPEALGAEQAVTSEQGSTSEIEQVSTWYLYLIRCANGHLYTGITTDVARRFNEHQSNSPKAAKYLRGKGPLTLMYQEQVGTRSDAIKREIAVKKLSRAQKLGLIESVEHSAQ